ncbi:hypothetical protein CDIK_3658 [Cucumispora dikerogammari]|nr:hypothetical protein CDIK_3658 [Cucumispora dikerogammari]
MLRRVLITNELKRKIILYKTTSNYEPENMTVEQKRKIKDVSKKFRISPIDSRSLEYIKSPTVFLKVFLEEQTENKLNFIELIYSQNIHTKKRRFLNLLKDKLYFFTRTEVKSVCRKCPQCVSKSLLNTKSIIRPIKSFFIKEKYLFDLVDLRHYCTLLNKG